MTFCLAIVHCMFNCLLLHIIVEKSIVIFIEVNYTTIKLIIINFCTLEYLTVHLYIFLHMKEFFYVNYLILYIVVHKCTIQFIFVNYYILLYIMLHYSMSLSIPLNQITILTHSTRCPFDN